VGGRQAVGGPLPAGGGRLPGRHRDRARACEDRQIDARTLATLLWKGELEAVWTPDDRVRVLRRRLSRREQLVRARTRAKNEVHGVLMRTLQGKPPCSDMFGVKGRRWLKQLQQQLAVEEAETLASALRQIDFLEVEIEQAERTVAKQMLDWPEAKRLLTVPGVNVMAAATFLAAVGDIARFRDSRKLIAYLGLDPRVRQSGDQPARPARAHNTTYASTPTSTTRTVDHTRKIPGPKRRSGRCSPGPTPQEPLQGPRRPLRDQFIVRNERKLRQKPRRPPP
jgi:transposase